MLKLGLERGASARAGLSGLGMELWQTDCQKLGVRPGTRKG